MVPGGLAVLNRCGFLLGAACILSVFFTDLTVSMATGSVFGVTFHILELITHPWTITIKEK